MAVPLVATRRLRRSCALAPRCRLRILRRLLRALVATRIRFPPSQWWELAREARRSLTLSLERRGVRRFLNLFLRRRCSAAHRARFRRSVGWARRLRRCRGLRGRGPRIPYGWAARRDRSGRSASEILSTFCTRSDGPLLLCDRRW